MGATGGNSGNRPARKWRFMSNEQVTELLRAAQQIWKKYRDDPPGYRDYDAWDVVIKEANAPLEGLPDYAQHIMQFFMMELNARAKTKEIT